MRADRCDLLCVDLPRAERIRLDLIDRQAATQASNRAAALADPTRLQVAVALAQGGELCGCDLAWIVGAAQNLVSHHLRRLRDADLAQSRRDGKMVLYSLTDHGRALVAHVLAQPAAVA
jgi:DNA-binding transcriptional ArsR family regulator